MNIFGIEFGKKKEKTKVLSVDDMNPMSYQGQTTFSPWDVSIFDGSKFAGGYGETQIQQIDYWTLRARSRELFTGNLYGRGIIRRLVTNEINAGLFPECVPSEEILGLEDGSLSEWCETVESRFNIWCKNPTLCDIKERDTFGAIQREARTEARGS